MMRLYESHVKHVKYLPWLRVDTPYLEELGNKALGTINGDRFSVAFTNSYGDPAHVLGKVRKIGRLWFLYGTAYGYKSHPDGRKAFAVLWRGDEFFHLAVPSSNGEFLKIKIRYEEY